MFRTTKTAQSAKPRQSVAALLQSAIELHRSGNLNEAQRRYRQILAAQPKSVDALYLDGVLAYQNRAYAHALRQLTAACKVNPALPGVHTALGNLYREQGDFERATACYQAALSLDAHHADAHFNLGIARHERKDLEGAITAYRQALAANPAHPEAWNNLGVALKALDRSEEAAACYARVIGLQPQHAAALFNLGVHHADAQRFDEAVGFYQRALAARPDYASAAFNLGIAFKSLGRLPESIRWFKYALSYEPRHADALQNLGASHHELGRLQQAEDCYRRALELAPQRPEVHYNLSLLALARGDYDGGWEAFEWRWKGAENSRRHQRQFAQPQWGGEDIAGKSILLHAEQGLGDTLQFVRYAPLVAKRGARVLLECQAPLTRLLQSMPGIDTVITAGEALPPFDWHCPLMSLPRAFRTRLDTVPADIPYLVPDALLVEQWKRRLSAEGPFKVGLVWAGSPRRFSVMLRLIDQRRSLHLKQLAPLARCAGASFVSLQLGEAAQQLAESPPGLALRDYRGQITDFSDTAALVANLDLVISVDTSVAHLAAAMGKPVWLLSRYDACWRWLEEREDSPWYPSLKIFRQPQPGAWPQVIERVAAQLTNLLGAAPACGG